MNIGRCAIALVVGSCVWADPPDAAVVIQTAGLNPGRPYFIPTHPRVTTTIRFPHEIGAPDGAVGVFTEDAQRQAGEYLVGWQPGEAYFTLMPLKPSSLANLNVPYQGETYVLFFYPVADPLQAVAAVNLQSEVSNSGSGPETTPAAAVLSATERQTQPPIKDHVVPTAARLVGFLDRLKLIHATTPGPALRDLVKAMNVDLAVSHEDALASAKRRLSAADGVGGEFSTGMNDAGLFQIVLLRAVRDRRLNCIGFICLVRNTSQETLTFDVNSFGARAGAEYLVARISDAPPTLGPGAQSSAYFVIHPPQNSPLKAANDWRISVDLVRPRPNPGAAISRGYGTREEAP